MRGLSEIGLDIAWASILTMPYAILASSLPQGKLGIYMGVFNVFIVVPQRLRARAGDYASGGGNSIMIAFLPT